MRLSEQEMTEYQTSLGENMLKVVSPDRLESLSMEEIEKLSENQMQYVKEAELLRRHIGIQQKIFQKTKYRKDE